ncbi:unnamed protein product [Mycena citricolor]|uniref:Glycosyltransferase family 15 protein n=1 Tax=Mycena citricolor TaxID=2018698 RepID=A0AAD2GZN4_9AGAR|nr:unnamed protein product [Mycena citricolor]
MKREPEGLARPRLRSPATDRSRQHQITFHTRHVHCVAELSRCLALISPSPKMMTKTRYGVLAFAVLIGMHYILSFSHEGYGQATSLESIAKQFSSSFPKGSSSNSTVTGHKIWHEPPYKTPIPDTFYLKPNTTQRRANAVIVSLARNGDLDGIIRSVAQLEVKFNQKFKYPYVFLNEEPFTDHFKNTVRTLTDSKVEFGLIPHDHWFQPDWIDENKAAAARQDMIEHDVIYGGSVPYRNMCRFNSGFFYRHELLKKYRYYWRVEPDVNFYCNLDYDPFLFMQDESKKYGFTISLPEYERTIPTLWATVRDFIKEYPELISPENAMGFLSDDGGLTYNNCHFWSNFEIADLDLWRGEAYTKFFDFLDSRGGFYYERWGDAPVHSIGAALFARKDQIHFFDDIGELEPHFVAQLGPIDCQAITTTRSSTVRRSHPTLEDNAGVTSMTTLIARAGRVSIVMIAYSHRVHPHTNGSPTFSDQGAVYTSSRSPTEPIHFRSSVEHIGKPRIELTTILCWALPDVFPCLSGLSISQQLPPQSFAYSLRFQPVLSFSSLSAVYEHSAPSNSTRDADGNLKPPISPHTRRHSRIHSRNLSVFFPRPGSVSEATIDEDGVQELEIRPTLGAGFSFGTTPPPEEMPMPSANESGGITPSSSASRRGHHHKHSVSHTFFSFLEPRGTDSQTLVTQPTPTPISPWMPISPFPSDASLSSVPGKTEPALLRDQRQAQPRAVYLATATGQFLLGATLWVQGQQCGSLSVTALGYWAVFDAIGVAIPHLRFHVSKPYATARTLPVLLFAQSVYLMFSAVYVCKEALEHLLLSADAGDGHHHHAGDEVAGILFPLITTFSTFCTLAGTALILDSHARLVSLAGNRIPPLRYLLSSKPAASASLLRPEPTAPLARALSNPYSATPLLIALGILGTALVVPPGEHRPVDLALAGAASAATFSAAYRACIVLGAVLLQTAPARGLRSGRMEAFLRAMRDVERHPQVLHLPAPHIWQLAADGGLEDGDGMVVTLEVHVSPTLGDDDVLMLTRWVRDRVATALGMGGSSGQAEVTVGVVRG